MFKEKLETLANFKGVKVKDIIDNNDCLEINEEGYLVLTDDEADKLAKEDILSLINDMGLNAFSEYAREYIVDNFIDKESVLDYVRDEYTNYCEDISCEDAYTDGFESRLAEEMADNNCDTIEDYIEELTMEYDDKPFEYFVNMYGDNEAYIYMVRRLIDDKLIDLDGLCDWVIAEDGRGNILATYDGKEYTTNGYYIYRTC